MGSGIRFYVQAERIKGKQAPDNVHYREWYAMPGGQQSGHVDDDIRRQHAEEYRSWKRYLTENIDMLKGAALAGLEQWEKEGGVPVDQLIVDPKLRDLNAPELNAKKSDDELLSVNSSPALPDPYLEKKEEEKIEEPVVEPHVEEEKVVA